MPFGGATTSTPFIARICGSEIRSIFYDRGCLRLEQAALAGGNT